MGKINAWIINEIRYVTVKDFADHVKVSRQTIYNWVYRGMPSTENEDGRFLILLDEAIKWIRNRGFIK